MPAAKKRPAKKAPSKKPSSKPAASTTKPTPKKRVTPAKKAPAKKVASKPTAKSTAKKTPSKKISNGQSLPRDFDEHGFVKDSDSAIIADVLINGGATNRADAIELAGKALKNKQTRNGNPPNVSSLVANVIRRMKAKGYTIQETWTVVAPTPASKAAVTRAAKRAAAKSDTPSKSKKANTAKAPAKKVAAKKRPSRAKG